MERQLVCEGACNPNLHVYDAAVQKACRSSRWPAEWPRTLIDGLRGLTHTPHRHVVGNRWACFECGADRRY